MIHGVVTVAGREWTVREEKRQGAQAQAAQLLILEAVDGSESEMHVRPGPGREASTLGEVEPLAYEPLYRWVTDADGRRWEVRMVVPDPPVRHLVKFICWGTGVFEGAYPHDGGLGLRTDTELRDLLADLKGMPPS